MNKNNRTDNNKQLKSMFKSKVGTLPQLLSRENEILEFEKKQKEKPYKRMKTKQKTFYLAI